MTTHYWARKLEGAYVYVDGKYKCIDGIHTDVPVDHPPLDFRYPEEYLPFIRFQVGGNRLKYEEFTVKFPAERYRLVDGVPVWGQRTMRRAWKMGPNEENMKLTPHVAMREWLNAADHGHQLSLPSDLFNWDGDTGCVFSDELACSNYTVNERKIMHRGVHIGSLYRNDTVQYVAYHNAGIPDDLKLWSTDRLPYVWPAGVPMPEVIDEDPVYHYHWDKVPAGTGFTDDYQFMLFSDRNPLGGTQWYMVVHLDDENWTIRSERDVWECFGDESPYNAMEEYDDVTNLFMKHLMPLQQAEIKKLAEQVDVFRAGGERAFRILNDNVHVGDNIRNPIEEEQEFYDEDDDFEDNF